MAWAEQGPPTGVQGLTEARVREIIRDELARWVKDRKLEVERANKADKNRHGPKETKTSSR